MKPIVKIKEWFFVKYKGERCLVGRLVQDHHKVDLAMGEFIQGHRVVTSKVVCESSKYSFDGHSHKTQPYEVETQNTIYELVGESSLQTVYDIREQRGIHCEPEQD